MYGLIVRVSGLTLAVSVVAVVRPIGLSLALVPPINDSVPAIRAVLLQDRVNASPRHPLGQSARLPVSQATDRNPVIRSFSNVNRAASAVPSPGRQIDGTIHDRQHFHSQGYQIAKNAGADIVHFAWMGPWFLDELNPDQIVIYNSYTISTGTVNHGSGVGVGLGLFARSQYVDLAVGHLNDVYLAFHQRSDVTQPFGSWVAHFPTPGSPNHTDDSLPTRPELGELLWPRIEVQQPIGGGADVCHVVAHGSETDPQNRIVYWRFAGGGWEGPVAVDSNATLGYVVAADSSSQRVAIAMHSDHPWDGMNGLRNVAYYESATRGTGWIDGTELGPVNKRFITAYNDSLGPEAWVHISCAYDHAGRFHAIWDEKRHAIAGAQVAIRHWRDDRGTIRPAVFGYWDNPRPSGVFDLNLAKMTLGIGDGSTVCSNGPGDHTNRDYLYVVYTQFGGPTAEERADYSRSGFMNGELCLSVSNSSGDGWSPPINLTNTKSPGCTPWGEPYLCASEHSATTAKTVDDIHILYIRDYDAGIAADDQGYWTEDNPVMYLRLPGGGTDPPYLCPLAAPSYQSVFSGPASPCGYYAPFGGEDAESLTVGNTGPGTLTGLVVIVYTDPPSPPTQWCSVNGNQSVAYSIPPGGPNVIYSVAMAASGLSSGLYRGEMQVIHNDPSQPNPQVYSIVFAVAPCPCHADPQCDGVANVQDVVQTVNVAFRGTAPAFDPNCPRERTDVNCDGFSTVQDVVKVVNVAFRGANPATEFCEPCL